VTDETKITLADVRRLKLEEGDTLVVFVPDNMSIDAFKQVRKMMAEVFPEHRALAMPESMRLEVVSKIDQPIEIHPNLLRTLCPLHGWVAGDTCCFCDVMDQVRNPKL
jgi:hypothetical protein